jgi:HEAT repeat protein
MDDHEQDTPGNHPTPPGATTSHPDGLVLIEGLGETTRPVGANTATVAQARRIAIAFSHTAKACRLYPPENRLRLRFTEDFFQALEEALLSAPAVNFLVAKTHLEFGGEIVFEQENREEMVPGRLYWDGLRHLSFHAGISPDELHEFLEILVLAEVKRDSGDEDLATLLWSRHFPHIRHLAIDELVAREEMFDPFEIPDEFTGAAIAETGVATTGAATATTDAETTGATTAETDAETKGATRPAPGRAAAETALDEVWSGLDESDEAALFEIPPEALQALRGELEPPADPHAQRADFLRIVRETLSLEMDEPALVDLVEIVRSAIVALLRQEEFTSTTELVGMLRDLRSRTPAPPPGVCRSLDRALALELEESALQAWVHSLDEPKNGALDSLPELMQALAPGAISTLLEVLGRLETARARRRLIDLLAVKGRDHVALFAPYMQDRRWYLVRNVALILGGIGNPESIELLRLAVHHVDVRVRKQVLAALSRSGGSAAMLLLSNALADHDPGLRLWAARALAASGPRALPRLATVLESKEFERKDLSERAAFYEAYAYAGRTEAVAYLRKLLEQKALLKPRHPDPVRACLCRALGVAGGAEAMAALEKLQGDRSVPVREAARAALSMPATGAPASFGGSEEAP